MRIAILTNTFPPDGRGGAERIAWIQASRLASLGHTVKVWKPIGPEEPKKDGYEVVEFVSGYYTLPNHGFFFRVFYHLFDLWGGSKLVREIMSWKPDVLLTHNVTGCGIGTGKRIQSAGIRWVHILHDIQLFEHSGQIRADKPAALFVPLMRAVWGFLCRGRFGTPDVMVSPTKWLIDLHRAYGFSAKSEVILPNPIEMDTVHAEGHRSLNVPASIAFVGRLSEEKGFGAFLRAIPKLGDVVPISGIVIVGEGPLVGDAYLLNDPRIECCGLLSPEESRMAIKNTSLLIAPSLIMENQPTVLLEAMAFGTPVIATDVGGTHETLEGTGCPVLSVNQDLGAAIVAEIKRLFYDSGEWQRVSDAMYAQAKRHDVGEYMKKLVEIMGVKK